MTGRRDNPHDSFFRGIMSEPAYAATELQAVLPEQVSAWLDWSTLRKGPADYVTEDMRARFGDLLFEVDSRDGQALIYVAMEHQSSSGALAGWSADLAEVADGSDAFRVLNLLVRYIMLVGNTEERALTPLFEGLGPEAKEALETTADRLRAEG
ncbi:Rpn family recombination-promoting nuclease/putative transposase [Nocardia asteroides]|uniref:Rpn family recombination-promoting nuclease/putative transposase n=1 Tax=Nocardia asteroides TaxID=1824 RepID=UPI003792E085